MWGVQWVVRKGRAAVRARRARRVGHVDGRVRGRHDRRLRLRRPPLQDRDEPGGAGDALRAHRPRAQARRMRPGAGRPRRRHGRGRDGAARARPRPCGRPVGDHRRRRPARMRGRGPSRRPGRRPRRTSRGGPGAALKAAPPQANASVEQQGDLFKVRVSAVVRPNWAAVMPSITVSATAFSPGESTHGGAPGGPPAPPVGEERGAATPDTGPAAEAPLTAGPQSNAGR